MSGDLPDVRHLRLGYLREVWGDIALNAQNQPQVSGRRAQAVRDLYTGLCALPPYQRLAPAQRLALMAARLRGPTWAAPVIQEQQEGAVTHE